MATWQPDLYLKFERERTQPSLDLIARIRDTKAKRIIDIGCGPGNSTMALRNNWPDAEITGLDSSSEMIEKAKKHTGINWVLADAAGDLSGLGKFDIVYSNAAIQWMPDHPALLGKLYRMLTPGGVLAVQVPYVGEMPVHLELSALENSGKWKPHFDGRVEKHSMHDAPYYYDVLSTLGAQFNIWVTTYIHVMENHEALVEWYSGSALLPYFKCLDEAQKDAFRQDYLSALRKAYPVQADGKVLFPFYRIFFTVSK